MLKRITAAILISILLVTTLAGCRPTLDDGLTIRVGHVLAPDHPYSDGLKKFSELVYEKTDGKVFVDYFHSSQLGNERDMIEGLQLGTLEMALVSTAPLSSFTKEFLVFDLPFIFKDAENARNVLDGPIGDELFEVLDSQYIKGLAYWENGFRSVTNNRGPIETPEDMKGLKVRTMENPVHMASFNALGASPSPMAFGELFTALQQKTIDGQENPLPIVDTSKFYEVQDYLSLTEHFYAPAPLLISQKFYDSLTPEVQQALQEAAEEARDYERGLIDEMNAKLITELEEYGMEINFPDKQPFIDAVQPVYEQFSSVISPELIQRVIDAQE